MKTYLSIPHLASQNGTELHQSLHITAFDKLDGSNIRAEWNPKKGFHKFGSRKVLINKHNEHLGKAVTLIQDLYAEQLADIFKDQKWKNRVTCFFEYYGPRSFAGNHHPEDNHTVTLIDVSPFKCGLVPPRDFIKLFKGTGIPKILYKGEASKEFISSVKNSSLEDMTLEGVVCKASNPNGKKTSQPIMFKVKSNKWLEMLQKFVDYDEELFKKLV